MQLRVINVMDNFGEKFQNIIEILKIKLIINEVYYTLSLIKI